MKKLVLIAAAVAAIASCAKVETINTSTPQQIAFEGYNFGMTKAQTLTGSLGVYASKNADGAEYFGNTEFKSKSLEDGSTVFVGDKYWPREESLDFTLYAPYSETIVTPGRNEITTKGLDAETDFLYGATVLSNKTSANGTMDITLKHAKCMVEVKVASPSNGLFKINSVNFGTQSTKGDVTITYNEGAPNFEKKSAVWSNLTTGNLTITKEDTEIPGPATTFCTQLLIPSDVSDVTADRKIESLVISYSRRTDYGTGYETLDYTYTPEAPITLQEGKNYVFTLTFAADEITFNPTIEDWTVNDSSFLETVTPTK